MSISASQEGMRIIRSLEVHFPTGPPCGGSAFIAGSSGELITCAHVVVNDYREQANKIVVKKPNFEHYEATIISIDQDHDLASLASSDDEAPPQLCRELPEIGSQVVFAGKPLGVSQSSVFFGMVSALGDGLLPIPRCNLIQISGMINNGNSGGPLISAETNQIIGVITAKYVPLLQEIDKLSTRLEEIPQFPSEVGLGKIDFSQFVNLTIRSMWQLAKVLRLVQVGTGWAVPAEYFNQVGVG